MKNLLTSVFFFLSIISGYTQGVSINETGIPADGNAMLDVSSHAKGVLIPRLRTNERLSIVGPTEGLLVYDIDAHGFWFAQGGVWKELLKTGDPLLPTGAAGGDLSGSYPSPTVVKIQNLDVSPVFPFDKQVLKWDALSNNWKGRNDSLFLPYSVAFGSPTKLFGIQNNNTTSGSSAICGKSGSAGSGITPGATMGVWGDNSNGLGVVGTSNTGIGTYGFSSGNHGVYGYSTLANFAGVCGTHANANGIGVLGEVQNSGIGVYGRSTGTSGKAGVFENTNPSNADTTLVVKSSGFGPAGYFTNSNTTNGNAVVEISSNAQGDGIYCELTNTGNYAHANFRAYNQSLGGYAFYGQTDLGTSCYLYNTGAANNSYVLDTKTVGLASVGNFTIANALNTNYILQGTTNGKGGGINLSMTNSLATSVGTGINVNHSGSGNGLVVTTNNGKAGVFSTTNASTLNETLYASTNGDVRNAIFKSINTNNFASDVYVEQNGNGKGIEVSLTKSSNANAGIYVNTAGNRGIDVISAGVFGVTASATSNGAIAISGNTGQTANNGIGVRGTTGANVSNGIGVVGESGGSDPTGIGVKGISNCTGSDRGAITGINNTTGIAVYGEADGTDGIGIYGLAGSGAANSKAAIFKNISASNSRTIVEVSGNGTGNNMFVNNTNASNSSILVRLRNNGSGNFLTLEDGGATSVTTIGKNGNINTAGTLVVNGDKGIVRSSTSTQLRTEIVLASMSLPGGGATMSPMESRTVSVTFASAFSSTPTVYIGNLVTDSNASFMLTSIKSVTTTGCDLIIRNPTNQDIYLGNSSWKLVALGAE